MIEVSQNLYVGSESDEYRIRGESDWFVVHACKEPYHRRALGYTGRAAAKDHPEYLIARRPGCLILNLVDVDNINFIAQEIIDAALVDIHSNVETGKVLVHCNQGHSRSPTIALLYLAKFSPEFRSLEHAEAVAKFVQLYPMYNPARGMAEYARLNWQKYSTH